jgi:hypothetical protein
VKYKSFSAGLKVADNMVFGSAAAEKGFVELMVLGLAHFD